ncbi:hypothetical protein FDECE_4708 [Fusarium decemcellulare]|nr:hypothetical protein FDECE_4708 [Fusarium decemcellulare]
MVVRLATEADLPALKDIVLSGLSTDAIWRYAFPHNTPEASEYLDSVLKQCIDPQNTNWTVSVVEAPKTHQVVSLAIWQTLQEHEPEENSVANQLHRVFDLPTSSSSDKVAKRIAALQAAITQTQQTYLSRYGELMFLHAVITHPHWKRQGYAKLLVKQSLQVARSKGLVAAALASPFSGYVFYSGTSFSNCGRTTVEAVEGELDKLELQIMVNSPPPRPEARRSSIMDFLGGGGSRASTPDRRDSHDQQAAPDQRRSSFLDVFGFGTRRSSADNREALDARRSSHA